MLYFSHLLPDSQMREIIRGTGMGVESIEFSIAENLDRLDDCLRAYERRLLWMGCPGLILHGPFLDLNPMTYDSLVREVTMERYQQAYRAARALGAEKIVFHSCHMPQVYLTEGWAERTAGFFREFLKDKDEQIQVLVENVLEEQPEQLEELASQVEHPAFGLCLDLGHAHCYAQASVLEWIKRLGSYIRHVHVHDNDGQKDSHEALGRGTLPWERGLELLSDRQLTYAIECAKQEAVMDSWRRLKGIFYASNTKDRRI